MAIPLVDLKAQYRTIANDLDGAVARVLANTSFILGSEVEAFEQAFTHYVGTRYAVGVSSGTDALHLALAEAAGVDYFCTCDDRLLRRIRQIQGLKVKAVSPIQLIEELGTWV